MKLEIGKLEIAGWLSVNFQFPNFKISLLAARIFTPKDKKPHCQHYDEADDAPGGQV